MTNGEKETEREQEETEQQEGEQRERMRVGRGRSRWRGAGKRGDGSRSHKCRHRLCTIPTVSPRSSNTHRRTGSPPAYYKYSAL